MRNGTCTTANSTGSGIDLLRQKTSPGSSGSDTGIQAGPDGGGSSGGEGPDEVVCDVSFRGECYTVIRIDEALGVTLSDIAHFTPRPEVQAMEPNGWMVVGLDTNFYTSGGSHIREGELLGAAASVRFTPVAWHWDYGDGATRSTTVPGRPWEGRSEEFDPTATSHVYDERGEYVIRLSVDFAAEYRIAGGPWIGIPGTLTIPANELVATAGKVKTVLVEHDCIANPSGPGC